MTKFVPYVRSKAPIAADAADTAEKSREVSKDSHLSWEPIKAKAEDGRSARWETRKLNAEGYNTKTK